MTKRAIYTISIDGQIVTTAFAPYLISMTIKDGDGDKGDSLDITLDDEYGQILLPRSGADIVATLRWQSGGAAVTFTGKTDEPKSEGSRGGGMILSITGQSADLKGRAKEKKQKHKDKSSFKDVAQEWGGAAGFSVKVDGDLASINRDYWFMANESFLSWGARIAREIGATFKVSGANAVFVPRNSDKSASGKALAPVLARRPGNVIAWSMSPSRARPQYKKSVVRWYDEKAAKWMKKEVEIGDADAVSNLTETKKAANADRAGDKAKANAEDAKRKKGGGSITIDGEPTAQAQAPCIVSGVRAGIDGTYRIASVTHTYTRDGGWVTACELEQPQGNAGTDSRRQGTAATSGGAAGQTLPITT